VSDDGYATPAALVLSLAFALVATAMTARAVSLLNLTRADYERERQGYALDGAQLQAAAEVIRSGADAGPFEWSLASDIGWIRILAERESAKLSPDAAAALPDPVLSSFGVTDVATFRAALARLDPVAGEVDAGLLAAAPNWRACGASLVSAYGEAERFEAAEPRQPAPGPDGPAWRVGEVWRIRTSSEAGWRDDRIVRFTGDARRPAAIVARRLSRGGERGIRCSELLNEAAG
jgi:hypothetical protein